MSIHDAIRWILSGAAGTLLICAWMWVKTKPWDRWTDHR